MGAGPAFTGGAEGSECNLIIFDAGDVLHDAFAIGCPSIDAEGEVSSQCGRLPFAPSAPRLQSRVHPADVPEVRGLGFTGAWVEHSPPKRLRNASAVAASGKQNRI